MAETPAAVVAMATAANTAVYFHYWNLEKQQRGKPVESTHLLGLGGDSGAVSEVEGDIEGVSMGKT